MKRVHLIFYGDVQGVFFRTNTKKKADSLGINGFVRNLNDGSVEAVFEGEKINELIKFCKTSITKVTNIKIKEEKPEGLKSFKILK